MGETVKWKWINFTVPGGSLQWGHWYPPHLWIWRRETNSPGEISFQSWWWWKSEVNIGNDSWLFKLWRPSLLGKGGCSWHQVWAAVRWKHFSLWRSQWLFSGPLFNEVESPRHHLNHERAIPTQLFWNQTNRSNFKTEVKSWSNLSKFNVNAEKFNRMKVSDQSCPNSEYFQWNPWTYILMVDFDTGFWSN